MTCRQPFAAASEQHLAALTAQLLASQQVPDVAAWCPIITCLALGAAAAISPTAMAAQGNQDPAFYIKVGPQAAEMETSSLCSDSELAWVACGSQQSRACRVSAALGKIMRLCHCLSLQHGWESCSCCLLQDEAVPDAEAAATVLPCSTSPHDHGGRHHSSLS